MYTAGLTLFIIFAIGASIWAKRKYPNAKSSISNIVFLGLLLSFSSLTLFVYEIQFGIDLNNTHDFELWESVAVYLNNMLQPTLLSASVFLLYKTWRTSETELKETREVLGKQSHREQKAYAIKQLESCCDRILRELNDVSIDLKDFHNIETFIQTQFEDKTKDRELRADYSNERRLFIMRNESFADLIKNFNMSVVFWNLDNDELMIRNSGPILHTTFSAEDCLNHFMAKVCMYTMLNHNPQVGTLTKPILLYAQMVVVDEDDLLEASYSLQRCLGDQTVSFLYYYFTIFNEDGRYKKEVSFLQSVLDCLAIHYVTIEPKWTKSTALFNRLRNHSTM